MLQERFKYIFGITRGPVSIQGQPVVNDQDNTFTAEFTAAADRINRSDSDLFLDEMEELPLSWVPVELNPATLQPVVGSIWELAVQSRHNALRAMQSDIRTALSEKYRPKTEAFTGVLGSESTRGVITGFVDGQTITTTIQTSQKPGHVLIINSLALHTSLDAVVPLRINDKVYAVKTRANRIYKNYQEEPIIIPMDGNDIIIEYTINAFMVGDNKMCYTCGGKTAKITPYLPNIADIDGNGLHLDVMLTCNPDRLVIENYKLDYNSSADVLAYAARFKTAALLMDRILNSGVINRFTMSEGKYLTQRRNYFQTEYMDRIRWLATEGFNMELDDCYQCKPVQGFRKRGIMG